MWWEFSLKKEIYNYFNWLKYMIVNFSTVQLEVSVMGIKGKDKGMNIESNN